jgi:hypothetical protein
MICAIAAIGFDPEVAGQTAAGIDTNPTIGVYPIPAEFDRRSSFANEGASLNHARVAVLLRCLQKEN